MSKEKVYKGGTFAELLKQYSADREAADPNFRTTPPGNPVKQPKEKR